MSVMIEVFSQSHTGNCVIQFRTFACLKQ
jgi:hypothetical protein